MKKLTIIMVLFLFPVISFGAISRDSSSVSSNSGWVSCGTSYNLAHTIAGADELLVVFIQAGSITDPVTAVTYAGEAMTQTLLHNHASPAITQYMYTLLNPATGTNNVTVTLSPSETYCMVGASSYIGAGSVNATNSSDVSNTHSITTTVADTWLVSGHYTQSTLSESTNVVFLGGWGEVKFADSNATVPSGSNNYNVTGQTTYPASLAIAIAPTVTSGGGGDFDLFSTTTPITYGDWLFVNSWIIFLLAFIPAGFIMQFYKKT